MKIFYSWQMDSVRKLNKDVIHGALTDALDQLNLEGELAEAERGAIEIDQDTKGVMGSAPIAEVIFDKIRSANIFVADVTLVAEGRDGKRHINSNVAIELGFALGSITYEPIIKVMNVASGGPDQLPFDLRSRRHPMQYRLADGATGAEIARERKSLADQLKPILQEYFRRGVGRKSSEQPMHQREASTYVKSAFWPEGKAIGRAYLDKNDLFCKGRRLVAVRLIPKVAQERLSAAQCKEFAGRVSPLVAGNGYTPSTNDWGALSYNTYGQTNNILSGTQIFKSREIWSFANEIIWKSGREGDDYGKWFITHETIMEYLPNGISNVLDTGKKIILGESMLIVAAADLTDVYVHAGSVMRTTHARITEQAIELELDLSKVKDPTEIAFEFAKKIYAEAGVVLKPRLPSGHHT